jgi:hypothetical protein
MSQRKKNRDAIRVQNFLEKKNRDCIQKAEDDERAKSLLIEHIERSAIIIRIQYFLEMKKIDEEDGERVKTLFREHIERSKIMTRFTTELDAIYFVALNYQCNRLENLMARKDEELRNEQDLVIIEEEILDNDAVLNSTHDEIFVTKIENYFKCEEDNHTMMLEEIYNEAHAEFFRTQLKETNMEFIQIINSEITEDDYDYLFTKEWSDDEIEPIDQIIFNEMNNEEKERKLIIRKERKRWNMILVKNLMDFCCLYEMDEIFKMEEENRRKCEKEYFKELDNIKQHKSINSKSRSLKLDKKKTGKQNNPYLFLS